MKKISKFSIIIFLLALVLAYIVVTIVNNSVSENILTTLKNTSLPEKTILCDSLSATGKLIGNGDGMQYFGAILIKSDLSLDELNSYYFKCRKYRGKEWFQIEPQNSKYVSVVEHCQLKFKALENIDNYSGYYIVYSWGSSNFKLQNCDMRVHT
jgi:hypothetical protein